jgi:hypothetical protein
LTGEVAHQLIAALNAELAYRAAGFTDVPPYGEQFASPNTGVCLSKPI